MNANKPGENLTRGFLKRIWNYLTASLYQKKINKIKFYDKNWDNIKWKIRLGRLIFFSSIYFVSNHFLVEQVYANVKSSVETKKENFIERISKLYFNIYSTHSERDECKENEKNIMKKIFEELNNLNKDLFIIEEISSHDLLIQESKLIKSLPNRSEGSYFLKDLNDLEKYILIKETYNIIIKSFHKNSDLIKDGNSFNMILYKVTNLLNKNQLNDESDESKKFIMYNS